MNRRESGSSFETHRERSAVRPVLFLEHFHLFARDGSIGIPVPRYRHPLVHKFGEYMNFHHLQVCLPR